MEKHSSQFQGARLRLARTFHSFTQAELGEKVGVSAPFLCQLESGQKQPNTVLLQAIADVLGFEPGFFLRELRDEFRDDECHFRKRKTAPLYLRNRVLAHGTIFSEVVAYLNKLLSLPQDALPIMKVGTTEEIERAAEECRRHWDLGIDTPITSMMRVLEHAGVMVTRFYAGAEKIDAFSRAGARNVIVLNSDKQSTSRQRWDLAHECGHLVMHRGMDTSISELEEEADRFASALLLPRRGFLQEFPRRARLRWDELFALKRRWGVSVAAIVRRAYDLGIIGAVDYRRAYKYIHARGWHRGEPDEPPDESPEILPLAFNLLREGLGKLPIDVAQHLHLKPAVLQQVTGVDVAELPSNIVSLDRFRGNRTGPGPRTR